MARSKTSKSVDRNGKLRDNVRVVARLLRKEYHDFNHNNPPNPLANLLFVICSVQTTKINYELAYRNLRRSFPTFLALSRAEQSEIARILAPAGLSNQKARFIKLVLAELTRVFGKPTLAPLRHMRGEECEAFLTALPGVGKKVARCVMMSTLGRKVFPVDTHCWRVCGRLGWRPSRLRACTPAAMDFLQDTLPKSLRRSLHVNFLSLGREFCLPQRPRCPECPLLGVCPTGSRHKQRNPG